MDGMKRSLNKPGFSRRARHFTLWMAIVFPLYVFSTGPVSWATNDAFHTRYLPESVEMIYLPLAPLTKIECVNRAFYWWTAVVWQGFPAGYTTL